MNPSVRLARAEDLSQILRLWERTAIVECVDGALAAQVTSSEDAITLVAEVPAGIVGVAVGAVGGSIGWIYRLAVESGVESGTGLALLEHLEAHLAEAGARTLSALVDGAEGVSLFQYRGFAASRHPRLYSRAVSTHTASLAALAELGARLIDPGLWDNLKGVDDAKEIIERRVILPLARPELANRHSVEPPRAIVLFGPPGTGKTTFAKGIASRLGWPFIEIQPSELAGGGADRQAKELADAFDRILTLPAATIFVDEVEDIASVRHEDRRTSPSVTNEFLKQIPRVREVPHHLLVCATNWVSRLDPAFVRPGRFDYILPVGPPDEAARAEMWLRYVEQITDEKIDLDALVAASELFTAADIEFAAHKAAQRAFEREHFEGIVRRADTEEFLGAIHATKRTLTTEMVRAFEEDTARFARL